MISCEGEVDAHKVAPMLDEERRFLDSHRDELIKEYGEKFLVIRGEQVTGAFDTIEEALYAAFSKHGLTNVLIRRPSEEPIRFSAPAFTLGILSADTARSGNQTDGDGR
jgi:hypothetical protein